MLKKDEVITMKREEIKKIFPEATDEQLKAILDINGADLEKVKGKVTSLEDELKESKQSLNDLNTALDEAKKKAESNDDYKQQLEDLQKKVKEDNDKREADRLAKEEAQRTEQRFNAVLGGKKFNHEAIRADYLRKFGEALKDTGNVGKSDIDIFTALTKEDAHAFAGATVVNLAGASQKASEGKNYASKDEIMKIKDTAERQAAIAANIGLFKN